MEKTESAKALASEFSKLPNTLSKLLGILKLDPVEITNQNASLRYAFRILLVKLLAESLWQRTVLAVSAGSGPVATGGITELSKAVDKMVEDALSVVTTAMRSGGKMES